VAELPTDFLDTVAEIFGEAAARTAVREDRGIHTLLRLWERAQEQERRGVFKFIRSQMDRSDDKEGLVQISWVVGNGTYRTKPSLTERPWWLEQEEDWKAYVADRLDVKRLGADVWEVQTRGGEEVAVISRDEGCYEARYMEDPQALAVVRRFQTWSEAMADVVAHRTVREREPRTTEDEDSGGAV
jgi:hypothetical protein